ncbi:MAG: hypothetical protein R3B13_07920 [Polyangiaceae bacterium]
MSQFLPACGPPPAEGPGAEDCAIDVVLSGQIEDHVSGPRYCRASGIYDSPASRAKSWMDGPHGEFGVELFDVSEGQLGAVKAALSINKHTKPSSGWATPYAACDITIDEWRLQYESTDGASYLYVGTGTCTSPAQAYGTETGEVTFGDFSLRSWIVWSR